MKTDREKLKALLWRCIENNITIYPDAYDVEIDVDYNAIADYLIEHGVTIPVRCKDCIYNKNGSCYNSEEFDLFYNKDFYCANGEREEE